MVKGERAINIGRQVYIVANTVISIRDHKFTGAYKHSFL
jgi:hypothetical protein